MTGMHDKSISQLIKAQWTVVVVCILVFLYLARVFPETVVVRDSAATAARIADASSTEELRRIASGLLFLGHGATITSQAMFMAVNIALCLFVVLSIFNLIWLWKLRKPN